MTRSTAPTKKPANPPLRILSCNILAGGSVKRYREYVTQSWKHVLPTGKRANLDGLAGIIGDFDLVALQEADFGSLRSGFLNQTEYLAECAGFPYWSHQPNRKVAKVAASSNGLLSRLKPDEVLDFPLPGRIRGRGVLWARYGKGEHSLIVLVAHLSLGPQARAHQLGYITELLEGHPNAVLIGDLNTPIESPELRSLFARTSLQPPATPPLTFPSWAPNRAIDHILATSTIKVDELRTLPHLVSDHLPVAATIHLPEGLRLDD
ncbi:MAG TPA: endonuclease/exonuclease/phosphatase family protein [Dokdonella sp.]|uniref:endonuclease/exonuclease/phosphatase family protein n=1 Tax=Dokdonella sp. TaxID=2291710 RepID=UPI002D7EEB41|nr:endonuclease/exonuclease/phosphatase family protein [Dokdonella sp.]HET9032290.1 endonuclease/exonuclease/phosphatase family protein [Dokdonella sp.]